ncbi:tetratricopeptide repeat protein [Methanospirillum lacunae]|uniref:Uncharacterized protein n=1 Tax=Methanospirillum lacunae TaxID=668570 RepID=A0A2V2N112_9EURY|nr:tetratricopeptide repeat protein [Methanospirillum lacunae]PWR73852.1 hypothetical protein DK846_01395 [Methanospirillum lacunae]
MEFENINFIGSIFLFIAVFAQGTQSSLGHSNYFILAIVCLLLLSLYNGYYFRGTRSYQMALISLCFFLISVSLIIILQNIGAIIFIIWMIFTVWLGYEANRTPINTSNKYYIKGMESYKSKEYEVAIYRFNLALKHCPNNHDAYYGKGISLFKLNKINEAIEAFDAIIKFNPNYSKAYLGKAAALKKNNKLEEAKIEYKKYKSTSKK